MSNTDQNKIIRYDYLNDSISFRYVNSVAYANATEMAKLFGKFPYEYLRLPSTEKLIKAITGKSRTSVNQLVVIKHGSPANGGGTWLHETLALDFAQWLSVEFRLWCNDRIKELMKTGITATFETTEAILNNPDVMIDMLQKLKKERQRIYELEKENSDNLHIIDIQEKELETASPKVQYYNNVLNVEKGILTNIIAKELGMSAITLNKTLNEMKIIYKQGGTWVPYHQYQNKGYVKTRTYTYVDSQGQDKTSIHLLWTEKGREFIHRRLNKELVS